MTDPAGVGSRAEVPAAAPQPLPDLNDLIRAGEWRRALATARVTHADPTVEEALSAVVGILEGVRARRYPAARRSAQLLRDELARGETPEFTTLRLHLNPDAIAAALAALDVRPGAADDTPMDDRLAPALAAPLTRAEALNALGVRATLLGEEERARELFGEALVSDPGHYRALTNLGNLSLEAGDPVAAEARYREALKLNPEYDGAHHNLGVALRRQGRVAEGVSAIRQGQKLSMRRSREDTSAEMREQFRVNPTLRSARIVALVVVALLVLWALRGLGH